jgi:rhodanese-related sulfurtransferase
VRAIAKAETTDGVRIGVTLPMSKADDEDFVRQVASSIKRILLLQQHLFAIATTGSSTRSSSAQANSLLICGSSKELVERAVVLAKAKFMGRVERESDEGKRWVGAVRDMGTGSFDKLALWDVVRKAAKGSQMDPLVPPSGSRGIDQILSDARSRLDRVTAEQAYAELRDANGVYPTVLVDIRPVAQREVEGAIEGALIVERNVLEWRFDPRCDSRLPIACRYDLRVIVFCQEGYTSSLAAASLQDMGLKNATDLVGGIAAWKEAGLPARIGGRSAGGASAAAPSSSA